MFYIREKLDDHVLLNVQKYGRHPAFPNVKHGVGFQYTLQDRVHILHARILSSMFIQNIVHVFVNSSTVLSKSSISFTFNRF